MAPEIEKIGDSAYVRKAPSSSDVEAEMVLATVSKDGLKRQMKDRHIAMIRYGACCSPHCVVAD